MAKFSPQLVRSGAPRVDGDTRRRWRVILYNNHFHRLDDVVRWLLGATGCSEELALEVCSVCQEDGRAVCFVGAKKRCHEVAADLRLKGLQVEVDDY